MYTVSSAIMVGQVPHAWVLDPEGRRYLYGQLGHCEIAAKLLNAYFFPPGDLPED